MAMTLIEIRVSTNKKLNQTMMTNAYHIAMGLCNKLGEGMKTIELWEEMKNQEINTKILWT